MKTLTNKMICVVLILSTLFLTACSTKDFITLEIKWLSSNTLQNTYTITQDKEIDEWDISIVGAKSKFYINGTLIKEQNAANGSTRCSISLEDLSLKKGDICTLIITGDGFISPATYGMKINGENITFS